MFLPDGRFEPMASTRVIESAADAEGVDFMILDDLVAPDPCDRLAALYRNNPDHFETGHADPLWQGRLLGYPDILEIDHESAMDMRRAVAVIRRAVRRFYDTAPLYADGLHLVGWREGMSMIPHADNAHASGAVHEFAHRDFSAVLYLSDDHEGGGLYLPKQDILISPRRGMFVSLPAGLSHMHGVTPITRGLRITMAFFLTFDKSHAHRALHPELAGV